MSAGTFLALLGLTLVLAAWGLWYARMQQVAVPENRLPFLAVMAVGGVFGLAAFANGVSWFGGLAACLALIAGGLFIGLRLQSAQPEAVAAFAVGDPFPDFVATDDEQRTFSTADLRGRPVLLKLFRGHW